MHHLHVEEPNSSSIRIDRVHHLMEASSDFREQSFHLGLEHDPHLEHPKSHDEPSQGNELIAEEVQGEGIIEEEGAAVQDAEEAGKPVFEQAFINCACAGHGRGAYVSCESCCSLYHPQCLRME